MKLKRLKREAKKAYAQAEKSRRKYRIKHYCNCPEAIVNWFAGYAAALEWLVAIKKGEK